MSNYTGNKCPVCHQPFTDQDDIVVCPDCGTPYHRACWPKAGCVHAAEHGTFEWKPDNAPESEEPVCPNCGAHNPPGAHYCNHCGVPLPDHPENAERPAGQEPPRPAYDNPAYDASASARGQAGREPHIESFAAGPDGIYRKALGPDDAVEGIKVRDWATYLGPSGLYYLIQFYRMQETKRKVSISISALLLGPIYLFYRKMWKQGVIFALLDFLCALPIFVAMLVVSDAPLVSGMPTGWLSVALNVAMFLNYGSMLVRTLFAVYWYKNTGIHRIQTVYSQESGEQQRQDLLALRGGTSVPAVLGYLAVCVALTILLMLLGVNPTAVSALFTM